MSYEAKALFLNSLEQDLSHMVTAADMAKVLSTVSDVLAGYEMEQRNQETGPDDLLDVYLSALSVEGRSEKTRERYRYSITRLMESVRVPTRHVTVYHLRGYLAQEKDRGISDSTLEGNRQIYCAYFNWLHRENLIPVNPAANLGAIKCQKKVKKAYSDVDLENLKTQCNSVRDRAIIAFLLSTGCRISEMTQLNKTDMDLVNYECKVLGKGNKERTVYFDAVTAMFIKEYLATRTDDYEALFVGKGSDRLTPGGVRDMLRKTGFRADVEKVHPHRFRRTFATTRAARGMPIQDIAHLLGHEKIDTTMKYIEQNEEDIKYSYRKYSK